MTRTLLQNGTLIDGAGAAAAPGDLLIEDGRIARIGRFEAPADCRLIDCRGLTVAPGFIDGHSHSDLQVLEERREKSNQGVTAEVVGNCGFSPYPAGADRGPLQEFANGIFRGRDDWGWLGARAYLDEAARRSRFVNVLSLVGHGSLRIAHAGPVQGTLPAAKLEAMERSLSEALAAGAGGFSTGLMYAPGSSAPPDELLRLCRVVARHGKLYATHMRSYSWHLLEAIDEQLELARRSGCRLQISHLQAAGRSNWNKLAPALERIDKARAEGIDVAFDMYPYLAGSTVLTQLLPQSALDGGTPALLARLEDREQRKQILAAMISQMAQGWSDIFISAVGSAANGNLVGKHLAQIAELRGRDPAEVVLDLLVEEKADVNMISFNQNEENLRKILTHPLCLVISDGFYVKGRPHPRLFGTFPFLLGETCREKRWMSLPEAVHKITGFPARRFGLKDRGLLKTGYAADITVFDAARVSGPATYDSPETPPTGIRYVFRNGAAVLEA